MDSNKSAANHFVVEDLLDFSNEDDGILDNGSSSFDAVGNNNNSTDSSTVTVVDSCNSSSGGDIGCRNFPPESHFGSELCVPYDDLAELEWLSNFVEESFSSEDLQKMQLISGMKATRPDESSEIGNFQPGQNGDDNCHNNNINSAIAGDGGNNPIFHPEMLVPAKARSKRSRNAPCNWASRLLMLSPTTTSSSEPEIAVGRSSPHPLPHPTSGKKTVKAIAAAHKKKDSGGGGVEGVAAGAGNNVGDGRRCLHCATDKTPQWRTGPMGPKTLCNACGVRYKSGRLVPEYRPAASPTFVLTKHSNSHRKVMELRRQKDMMRGHHHHPQQFLHHHHHHHHQNMVFDVSNGDDYLIHQHVGPDFRQMI